MQDRLSDFLEGDPEAALSWLQLSYELGSQWIWERCDRQLLQRIFHPRHLMELMERDPEVALTCWLQLARKLTGRQIWEQHAAELFQHFYNPSHLTELMKSCPEAAPSRLRLIRELGGIRVWKQ
jgi:hypothetical protein